MNRHADDLQYSTTATKKKDLVLTKTIPHQSTSISFLDFSYLIQTQRAVFDPVTRLMTLEATVCSWDFSHLTSTPYFHVTWQMTETSLTLYRHASLYDLPYKNIKYQRRHTTNGKWYKIKLCYVSFFFSCVLYQTVFSRK